MSSITPKETVAEVSKYPIIACQERGIKKETLERFGVRAGVSETDGTTVEAYYFPSYNQKGKLVGYMKQDLTKGKEEEGHWTAIGSVSISNKLFGQDVAESINRKRNNFTYTEGQWDTLSTFQALVDKVKSTKWDGMEPFVVSIPLGTKNAVEATLHNEHFVKSFDALTFFFDDDFCTPQEKKKGMMKGHEAREAVANCLVGSGMSMFSVIPEEGMKDASDYLQAGKSEALAQAVQFDRRAYQAEKIVRASDISLEELLAPRPEGIYVDCFPKLMDKLHGFRTRELVLLTSPSGVGKSTVTSLFGGAFQAAGEKLGLIYLEETNKETFQRMLASKLKVNYLKFKNDPLSVATEEQIQEAYAEIVGNDQLVS